MPKSDSSAGQFVVEAFDREQWCPVLQARLTVPDIAVIRTILGPDADDDPTLRATYDLGPTELGAIEREFGLRFDIADLDPDQTEVCLYRPNRRRLDLPYLNHGGYELPLLLAGRKKLAKIYGPYSSRAFDGEARFDHWVAQGQLHRHEVVEPFETPAKGYEGHRTLYYTPKGEEWRIPAMELIWSASAKAGGWSHVFERLEGMLFGYEDWENDVWIEAGMRRGGFGGAALCCSVTKTEMDWLEQAGFRALPPCEGCSIVAVSYDEADPEHARRLLDDDPQTVALVVFRIGYLWLKDCAVKSDDGRWLIPSERIPELNQNLEAPVAVVLRRGD